MSQCMLSKHLAARPREFGGGGGRGGGRGDGGGGGGAPGPDPMYLSNIVQKV